MPENVYCFSQNYKHKNQYTCISSHGSYLLSACKTLLLARVLFAEWVAKLLAAAGYLIYVKVQIVCCTHFYQSINSVLHTPLFVHTLKWCAQHTYNVTEAWKACWTHLKDSHECAQHTTFFYSVGHINERVKIFGWDKLTLFSPVEVSSMPAVK